MNYLHLVGLKFGNEQITGVTSMYDFSTDQNEIAFIINNKFSVHAGLFLRKKGSHPSFCLADVQREINSSLMRNFV